MKKNLYKDMMRAFAELSHSDQQMFIESIMKFAKIDSNRPEKKSVNSMIKETSGGREKPDCPHCGAKANLGYIYKRGFYPNGSQRYSCKSCKKIFNIATNTVFERTRKESDVWKKFIHMTIIGESIAKCADECGLCIQTAFTWRHKVLNVFKTHQENSSMEGKIEVDEMFFPISFKGNHIKGGFKGRKRLPGMSNNLPRKSFKRGSDNKSKSPYDRACVFCMTKNGNEMFCAEVPGVGFMKPNMLDATLAKHVKKENSIIIADQYQITHKYLDENNYDHVIVLGNTAENPRYHRPEIKGEYHLQHVNAMHHHLRIFMKPYYGVSTKYLANYVALYTWLKNLAANKQKKRIDELSIRRASNPDCYLTRKAIEAMPAIPMCA